MLSGVCLLEPRISSENSGPVVTGGHITAPGRMLESHRQMDENQCQVDIRDNLQRFVNIVLVERFCWPEQTLQ